MTRLKCRQFRVKRGRRFSIAVAAITASSCARAGDARRTDAYLSAMARVSGTEPEPRQRLETGPTFGVPQSLLRQELLACDDRVVDPVSPIVQQGGVLSSVEVVDQDIRVYEDADRCHARIPLRKLLSERFRACRRSMRTYATLSPTSACP